ncbi:16S rRNA (cytosine(967)-C(5))-methyltransferase [hydrothermal vent metagenome]|uniref:16S rRNA (Cytosine(967)-C(5))-methyltransferase n=1 Tax=hydrothermal vent metagenome TaxID=652676 RepID=A0A3B1CIS9_9ZZZZ
MVDSARKSAYKILIALELQSGSRIEILLQGHAIDAKLGPRDKAFASEIVYGVTRWKRGLDMIIENGSSTPMERIDLEVLVLLRIGLYQIFEMTRTPISAAVNETVNVAKSLSKAKPLSGFVNGVLRGVIRNADLENKRIPISVMVESFLKKGAPEMLRLGAIHSFPGWIVKRWIKTFGPELTEKILAASNKKAPVFFRLNSLNIGKADFLTKATRWGVGADALSFVENGYLLKEGKLDPGAIPFVKGYVQPQDAASQLAASLLEVEPGDQVADICCGRGIKSGGFAQAMENKGKIFCLDNSVMRLTELATNMERQGVTICDAQRGDATESWPTAKKFTKIFVDAPCSGTGGFRRHPEGKWSKSQELVIQMSDLQKNILRMAVDRLTPGGHLVYAVCSIEPEEGIMQIENLLKKSGYVERVDLRKTDLPAKDFINDTGDLFILPGESGMDGFFAAKLRKI